MLFTRAASLTVPVFPVHALFTVWTLGYVCVYVPRFSHKFLNISLLCCCCINTCRFLVSFSNMGLCGRFLQEARKSILVEQRWERTVHDRFSAWERRWPSSLFSVCKGVFGWLFLLISVTSLGRVRPSKLINAQSGFLCCVQDLRGL